MFRLPIIALALFVLSALPASAQQQLVGNERLYWQPSPTPGVTYMLVLDGVGVDLGPCVQSALSVDHSMQCDAALPAGPAPTDAFAPGTHVIQIFAKSASGDSLTVPEPALVVLGIQRPSATAPGPPSDVKILPAHP